MLRSRIVFQNSGYCFTEDGSPKGAANSRVGGRLDTCEAAKKMSSVMSVSVDRQSEIKLLL